MRSRLLVFLGSLTILAGIGIVLIVTDGAGNPSPDFSPQKHAPKIQVFDAAVSSTPSVEVNATVVRVVDGDTLVARLDAEEGDATVRLLGIDTPETVDPRKPVECFGKEASRKTRDLLEGQRIRLEPDPEADERDRYGRLLRNAYLADGTDVNALLVRDGYAQAYLSFPLRKERKRNLQLLQEEARASGRGLWGSVCHS